MRNIIPKGGYVTDYSQLLSKVLKLEKIINEGGAGGDNTYSYYVNNNNTISPYKDALIKFSFINKGGMPTYPAYTLDSTITAHVELYEEIKEHLLNNDKVVLKLLPNDGPLEMTIPLTLNLVNGNDEFVSKVDEDVEPLIVSMSASCVIFSDGTQEITNSCIPFGYEEVK